MNAPELAAKEAYLLSTIEAVWDCAGRKLPVHLDGVAGSRWRLIFCEVFGVAFFRVVPGGRA
jgi:hypothetical protein